MRGITLSVTGFARAISPAKRARLNAPALVKASGNSTQILVSFLATIPPVLRILCQRVALDHYIVDEVALVEAVGWRQAGADWGRQMGLAFCIGRIALFIPAGETAGLFGEIFEGAF